LADLKESDSELKEKFHELIFELNRVSTSLIVKVLPLLEDELKVNCHLFDFNILEFEDMHARSRPVNLLHYMFGAKGSTLATNFRPLFLAFIGRFNDIAIEIRMKMVEFAKFYLTNHQTFISDIAGNMYSLQS
jgi:sister-chromatid-cohesion protein PDS5